jgi:hypothetical protein
MEYKRVSKGLGLFSIALGAAEVLAARRIARGLSMTGSERMIRGFGVREVTAGAGLLMAPAHSTRMWNRVAGDVMDLGALGLAARRAPKKKAVIGALAFVAGATLLDWVVARGLDRKTGKIAPRRTEPKVAPNAEETERADAPIEEIDGATSIEPPRVADPEPPQVTVAPA